MLAGVPSRTRWCTDCWSCRFVSCLLLCLRCGIVCAAQVLSPATILAIDLAALTLLDLPCLVAFMLGVLADEFGWVAKSFPQAFSVSS